MIADADRDGSGVIDFPEFLDMMTQKMAERDPREEMLKAFRLFDDDETGKISFKNLKRVAKELGENMTDDEIQEMIDEADRDGDGEIGEEEFAATFGRTSRDILRQFFGAGLEDGRIAALDRRKEELYRARVRDDFPAMPGAVALIDDLAAHGFRLAVASSGPPENVELALEKLGRAGLFGAAVTGADVTRGKPHPDVYLECCRRLGVAPSRRVVVVEDAALGLDAARAAGCLAVGVPNTLPAAALAPRADVVVESCAAVDLARSDHLCVCARARVCVCICVHECL